MIDFFFEAVLKINLAENIYKTDLNWSDKLTVVHAMEIPKIVTKTGLEIHGLYAYNRSEKYLSDYMDALIAWRDKALKIIDAVFKHQINNVKLVNTFFINGETGFDNHGQVIIYTGTYPKGRYPNGDFPDV